MEKVGVPGTPKNLGYNRSLEGRLEIAIDTALFYLEKGASLFPKGRFPDV